jgi:hypothetical protein
MQVFRCTLGRQIHNQRATGRTRGSKGGRQGRDCRVFAGTVSAMGQRTGGGTRDSGDWREEEGKRSGLLMLGWIRTRTRTRGGLLVSVGRNRKTPDEPKQRITTTSKHGYSRNFSLYLIVYLLEIMQIISSNLGSISSTSQSLGI